MARRRSQKSSSLSELVAGIFPLLALYLFTTFREQPLLTSAICGLLVAIFALALLWLWQQRCKRQVEWALAEQLYALSPKEFEHAVAELFRAQGYQATVSGGRNDRGVDVHLKRDGQKAAVQCKRYKQPITPAQIREFAGAMGEAGADHGYFLTTSTFTRMARSAARNSNNNIQLIDGAILGQLQNRFQKNAGANARSALIPAVWWSHLPTWQKAALLLLLSLTIWTTMTVIVYASGISFVSPG